MVVSDFKQERISSGLLHDEHMVLKNKFHTF